MLFQKIPRCAIKPMVVMFMTSMVMTSMQMDKIFFRESAIIRHDRLSSRAHGSSERAHPNKAGTHKVHGSPLGVEEVESTKRALRIT